jgi:hypothetical protein
LGTAASCQVTVTFKPLAAGNRSASISISDNAAGNPHSVSLTGTATQAAVSLSPSTVNFANQLLGSSSAPVALTLTNTGSGALVIGSISFSGTNATDFQEKDTCQAPTAPAATCLINVLFTPTAVGPRVAAMVLTDNASNAPQSVPLTGTAMNFAIDPPNVGATSATVTAGQTATYQLNLQSIDGFAGPVTLTCTGAPAGATCTVIPTPIILAANSTTPFQVQVSTTARPATSDRPQVQTPLRLQTPPHSPTNFLRLAPTKLFPSTAWRQPQAFLRAKNVVAKIMFHLANSLIETRLDSRFSMRAEFGALSAAALRVAAPPAPLTLSCATKSKTQIRRSGELCFTLITLIGFIAISFAILVAIARITAPPTPLAPRFFVSLTHSHFGQVRGEHKNRNYLPQLLAHTQRGASRSTDRVENGEHMQFPQNTQQPDQAKRAKANHSTRDARNFNPGLPQPGPLQLSSLTDASTNPVTASPSLGYTLLHRFLRQSRSRSHDQSLDQSHDRKPVTRHARTKQNFALHVSASLATSTTLATALAFALTLLAPSCGPPNPATQPSGTPAGTYLLTLTPTIPATSAPRNQPLGLTVQ